MLFFLLLGLLLGALIVIFALQNIVVIDVVFLIWHIQGYLSIILLSAVLSGVLLCILLSIPEFVRKFIEFAVLKKQIKKLEDDNASYKRIVGDVAKISETKTVESRTVITD